MTGLRGWRIAGCTSKKNAFEAGADADVVASGKKVKLLSVDGDVIEVDEAFLKPVPQMPAVSNSESRLGIEGKKFVMVIDLSRCKNLRKCEEACDHMHGVNPGQHWVKVYPMKDADTQRLTGSLPRACIAMSHLA